MSQRYLRACLKRSRSRRETPHHQLNHGDSDPRLGGLRQGLEVFAEPPRAIEPTKRALDDPAPLQDSKALGTLGAFHDREGPQQHCGDPRDSLAGVPSIRPDQWQSREAGDQRRQHLFGPISARQWARSAATAQVIGTHSSPRTAPIQGAHVAMKSPARHLPASSVPVCPAFQDHNLSVGHGGEKRLCSPVGTVWEQPGLQGKRAWRLVEGIRVQAERQVACVPAAEHRRRAVRMGQRGNLAIRRQPEAILQ
jgi:hypothetical protein